VSVRIDVTNSHMLDNSWGPPWRNANRIASRSMLAAIKELSDR
jgi:hypothetical protein